MSLALARSMDAITIRAVRRMTAGKDAATILRIHDKARDHRAHRSAMAFLSALRRPVFIPHDAPVEAGMELEAAHG